MTCLCLPFSWFMSSNVSEVICCLLNAWYTFLAGNFGAAQMCVKCQQASSRRKTPMKSVTDRHRFPIIGYVRDYADAKIGCVPVACHLLSSYKPRELHSVAFTHPFPNPWPYISLPWYPSQAAPWA